MSLIIVYINMINYIIDFERVNQLTTHPKDSESGSPMGGILSPNGVSRKIIKDYLEYYNNYMDSKFKGRSTFDASDDKFNMVVDTLLYNGILVDKRDKKLDQILN